MDIIQKQILLTEMKSEYLVAIPMEMIATFVNVEYPDRPAQIVVLVYQYSHREKYGFVYEFIGARIK